MLLYPTDANEAIFVVYDLRNPAQWAAAGEERRAWGRERSVIHALDADHVAIEYRPGGTLEASA